MTSARTTKTAYFIALIALALAYPSRGMDPSGAAVAGSLALAFWHPLFFQQFSACLVATCVTHWVAYLESQNTAIETPVANTDIEIISA